MNRFKANYRARRTNALSADSVHRNASSRNSSSRNSSSHSRGFTLVELQIAIVIMAMISVLLLGALRLTSQTWTKVTARQDAGEHQFQLSQLLRRHLSSARFFKVRLATGEVVDSLIGGPDYVHYVAPFPSFVNDGELYWWTLKIAWNEELAADVLVLEYQRFNSGDSVSFGSEASLQIPGEVARQLPLQRHIASLSLAYFGNNSGDDGGGVDAQQWHEEWLGERLTGSAPPRLLKLQLAVLDAQTQQVLPPWPALVLALSFAEQQGSADGVAP